MMRRENDYIGVQAMNFQLAGTKRPVGRPFLRWFADMIMNDVKDFRLNKDEIRLVAMNREEWKEICELK